MALRPPLLGNFPGENSPLVTTSQGNNLHSLSCNVTTVDGKDGHSTLLFLPSREKVYLLTLGIRVCDLLWPMEVARVTVG